MNDHGIEWNRHMNLSINKDAISELLWLLSPRKDMIVAIMRCEQNTAGLSGWLHGAFAFLQMDMVLGTCGSRFMGSGAMTRVATTRYLKAAPVPGTYILEGRVKGHKGEKGKRRTVTVEGKLCDWAEWCASIKEGAKAEAKVFVEGVIEFTVVDPEQFRAEL